MSKKKVNVKRTLEFENICKMRQSTLKKHMRKQLESMYDEVICADGFIFAKGTVPILLVAHMDTVHKELPQEIVYDNGKISSPQGIGGDDRCGIYMISKIIKKHHCSVLFTEDEEIGGVGAGKFVKHDCSKDLSFNYAIELDRKGKNDAVFYDCDNPIFTDFITETDDWVEAYGSYSDICDVAPAVGCAAVNLSCGYYNAHTKDEYVMLEEMETNINKVCELISRSEDCVEFEYIESVYAFRGWGNKSYSGYGSYSSYDDDMCYTASQHLYVVTYIDLNNKTDYMDFLAVSKLEALGMFVRDNPELTFNDVVAIDDYGLDLYSY